MDNPQWPSSKMDQSLRTEAIKAYYSAYRAKNRLKFRKYHKAWRERNHERDVEQNREERRRLRMDVFMHYGKGVLVCALCGYDRDHRALQLDHIANDGADGRRTAKGKRTHAGTTYYRWLRKNNYPEGMQLLCANCNWIKEIERRGTDYSL